ncbi:MAG: anti-sigma factor [Synechococcales bacterium]|nr:anti-sigma factor [Synechococcales bacterium]
MGPMIHDRNLDELQELLAGYVIGNLDSEEAQDLHQLLKQHPELRQDVRVLQEVLSTMPYALPKIYPTQGVRDRVLQNSFTSPLPGTPKPRLGSGSAGGIGTWMVGIAVGSILFALGLHNYYLWQTLQLARVELHQHQTQSAAAQTQLAHQQALMTMLQNPQTHLVSLRGQALWATASGNVMMTHASEQAIVVLQNLQPLPQGQVYVLWAVAAGQKQACGAFNADEHGTVVVKLPVQVADRNVVLAVTIEQNPYPQQPTGPMVLTNQT